jgi:hypothetical protein
MGRPPMFMDQNQYCENGYITKSNLHIPCNPHQYTNDNLHKNGKKSKIHMEA